MEKEALQSVIGSNITKYREQAGLTQAQLAELINVTPVFVSRVERGQKMMKVATLYATAQALRVSCKISSSCSPGRRRSISRGSKNWCGPVWRNLRRKKFTKIPKSARSMIY